MANPIQQGLKQGSAVTILNLSGAAAMANPIQQGLKRKMEQEGEAVQAKPQWLIQYNKD